jgi:hypothetical protein
VLKKSGDKKKAGEPEYQIYPCSMVSCNVNADIPLQQLFEKDLHPA